MRNFNPAQYRRVYYLKNKARINARNKAWYEKNKVHKNGLQKKNNRLRKARIMHLYGHGKCKNCGIKDVDVLSIDHKNNDGTVRRKAGLDKGGMAFYLRLLKLPKKRTDLQVLCLNCNWKRKVAA